MAFMKKLFALILALYTSASLELRAQEMHTLFDKDFNTVKKEKKAFYFSRYYFHQKGKESLLLISLDGSSKVTAIFRDGKFVRKEAYLSK